MNSRHNIAFLLLTALLAVRGFCSIPAPVTDAAGRVTQRQYTPAAAGSTAPLGVDAYQIDYGYYPNGQLHTLTTQRAGHTVVTEWDYYATTGLLKTKTIAGTVVESYTWNPDGTVATITDALGRTATYTRDAVTGDLDAITYSGGSAPGATLSNFDRRGRPGRIAGGAGPTTDFTYDAANHVTHENLAAFGLFGAVDLERTFDPATAELTSAGIAASPTATYGHDASGRVETVTGGGVTATYEYDAAGRLCALRRSAAGGPDVVRTLGYDAANRLSSIDESPAATFALTYGADSGKIERVDLAGGTHWEFHYDGNGHLESATLQDAAGATVAGRDFRYANDEIGNPLLAGPVRVFTGQPSTGFVANDSNQAEMRAWDCVVSVYGTVVSGCTVSAEFNGQTYPGRVNASGEFLVEFLVPAAQWPADGVCQSTLSAVQETATSSAMAQQTLAFPLGSASVVIANHDAGGYPGTIGNVTYGWAADGTLSAVEIAGTTKVEYTYDHQGRMTGREVSTRADTAAPWSLASETSFLYDGWRLLRERRHIVSPAPRDVTLDYAWGLDLSRSLDGAAGIGGLLAVNVADSAGPSRTLLPVFDWNGNAVRYLDATDLSVAAEFEYAPFGDLIAVDGPAADLCTLRFSTKYMDLETELVYFGMRWLEPRTAKWLSRDPLGEAGGENLYSMCGGDPVNKIDPVGAAESFAAMSARLDREEARKQALERELRWLRLSLLWRRTAGIAGEIVGPIGDAAGWISGGVHAGFNWGADRFFGKDVSDSVAAGSQADLIGSEIGPSPNRVTMQDVKDLTVYGAKDLTVQALFTSAGLLSADGASGTLLDDAISARLPRSGGVEGRGLIGLVKSGGTLDDALRGHYLEIARSPQMAKAVDRYNKIARYLGQKPSASIEDIVKTLGEDVTFSRVGHLRSGIFTRGQHPGTTEFWIQGNPSTAYGRRAGRHELTHLGAALQGQEDTLLHEIAVQAATTPENLVFATGVIVVIGGEVYWVAEQ